MIETSNPYAYVQAPRRPLLTALLCALPPAKEKFEAGLVGDAFKLLMETETVKVSPKVPIEKATFLYQIMERMPSDFCYLSE